jgi:AraC family transcriptional regulator, arabinose operon regulatory protein
MCLWCRGGTGAVTINGSVFEVQPNDYFVIPWNHMIKYESVPEVPFLLAGIHIIPWHAPSKELTWGVSHDNSNPLHGVPWRQDRKIEDLEELLHFRLSPESSLLSLSEYIVRHSVSPWRDRGHLQHCAVALINEVRFTLRERPAMSSQIQQMQMYIERNIAKPLSVRDLAREIGRSPSQIARLCRRYLKMSPGDWINDIKIRFACDRLRTTHESVADIAEKTGFADQFYFSRLFKKKTGLPPLRYRQQAII